MLKPVILIILIAALILSSCNHSRPSGLQNGESKKQVQLPYLFDLKRNLSNQKTVNLSSIGTDLNYIALETTPSSLLRKINQLVITDSNIFISDYHKLIQFDHNGKFIRQIGANGRGPGEYIYVSGFCVDNQSKKIYIIAWGIYSILEFNFDGKFIRSFNKSFESLQIQVLDPNKLVFRLDAEVTTSPDFKLLITDLQGSLLSKIKNYNKRTSYPVFMIERPMYFYKGLFHYNQFGVDTLYTLEDEELDPYAIFNLGKMKMDPDPAVPFPVVKGDEALRKLNNKLWIMKIVENNQYLFLELAYGLSDSITRCIANKNSLDVTFLESISLINDIDGGKNFWPKYIFNDTILVDFINAYNLINYVHNLNSEDYYNKYGTNFRKLKNLVEELKETSNPVLITIN